MLEMCIHKTKVMVTSFINHADFKIYDDYVFHALQSETHLLHPILPPLPAMLQMSTYDNR